MTSYRVMDQNDLLPGELRAVDAGPERVCLARLADGTVYAIGDMCTHEDASLSEGEIWDGSVQCPQHGSLFDLRTGDVTGLPAQIPARTFPVRIQDDGIFVEAE